MVHEQNQTAIEENSETKTILLVEDDIHIGEVLVLAISQETPYMALLAPDAFEALNMVNEVKPQLLILDYQLPRMNGLELYDRLHAMDELAQVPAIMISARLPYRELEKRNIMGINKPLDLDDFFQAIDHFLAH